MGNLSLEEKNLGEVNEEYLSEADTNSLPHKSPKAKKKKLIIYIFILLLLMIASAACGAVYHFLIKPAPEAVAELYAASRDAAFKEVYDKTYASSYDTAEAQHHVSNQIEISLGNVREIQRLEVLNVSEVDYQVPPEEDSGLWEKVGNFFDEDSKSWLEVPGFGVFTVNLKASEFIIDSVHRHVIIRIPNPKLTGFTIDYNNFQLLNFEDGGIFKDPVNVGVDTAMKQLQDAELSMMQRVNNNQDLFLRAQAAAETILSNIIRQLNPNMEDLTVDVEFYD